jgi:hypothetical protein
MKILPLTILLLISVKVNASIVTVTYDVIFTEYNSVGSYNVNTLGAPLLGSISTSFDSAKVQTTAYDQITPGAFILGISEHSTTAMNDQENSQAINWTNSFDSITSPFTTTYERFTNITANNYIDQYNKPNLTSFLQNGVAVRTSLTTGSIQSKNIQIYTSGLQENLIDSNLKNTFIKNMEFGEIFSIQFGTSKVTTAYSGGWNDQSSRIVSYDEGGNYYGTAIIRSVTDSADIAPIPLPPAISLFTSGIIGLRILRKKYQ